MAEAERVPLEEQEEPQNTDQDPPVEETPETEGDEINVEKILEERQAAQEEQAANMGWKPLEEFVKGGGDPTNWRPAGEFLQYSEFVNKTKEWERGFDNRAKRLEKYYKAQNDALRQQLQKELDQAVDEGDKDAVRNINKQMRDLDSEDQQEVPQADPVLQEWNNKNPWIYDTDDPKAVYAHKVWGDLLARDGQTGNFDSEQALRELESKVDAKFPKPKPRVPGGEKGGGSKGFGKGRSAKLAWEDLTAVEVQTYKATKPAWKSEEEYLKAVADARKTEEQ